MIPVPLSLSLWLEETTHTQGNVQQKRGMTPVSLSRYGSKKPHSMQSSTETWNDPCPSLSLSLSGSKKPNTLKAMFNRNVE
jgi:hypothetical protein